MDITKTSKRQKTMHNSNDWRSECKDIASMQNKARIEALFTDVQFIMGDGDCRKVFHAHKSILACASEVFEKMFFGMLAEKKNVIETYDDPEAFDMLLNFIYGAENKITSLTSAWKYFTIGDKYLIPRIQEEAKEYIKNTSLTENDFWDLVEKNIFSDTLFHDKVYFFVMKNANTLIESPKFLSVPETFIDFVVQMDKLNVSEYRLLLAVTEWTYRNKIQAASKFLMKYYKYIRFSTLTTKKYVQFMDLYPEALDAENCSAILRHLKCRSHHNLPKWCSTSQKSRFNEYIQYERPNGFYCDEAEITVTDSGLVMFSFFDYS